MTDTKIHKVGELIKIIDNVCGHDLSIGTMAIVEQVLTSAKRVHVNNSSCYFTFKDIEHVGKKDDPRIGILKK